MTEYRVNLEVFAGPMDLLLYLVRKEEVDIYDIPIARITEQYIHYIKLMQKLDLDLAGDFLILAATLMEIKSAMLLPRTEAETSEQAEADDPRAELVRQLLEYKRIKDAANMLADAAEEREQRFTRPDTILSGLKKNDEPEVDLDQVSIWTLLEAFDAVMKATGRTSSYSHITDETPIDLYQIEVLHRLQIEGPMSFEKVFLGKTDRFVMIGLFLAMLELMRNQLIRVEQAENKGPIQLTALTDTPAERAVQDAILSRQMAEELSAAVKPEDADAAEQEAESVAPTAPMAELKEDDEDEFGLPDDALAAEINAIGIADLTETQTKRPRIPIQEIPAPMSEDKKADVSQLKADSEKDLASEID
jgi:segregation and condensation protein A